MARSAGGFTSQMERRRVCFLTGGAQPVIQQPAVAGAYTPRAMPGQVINAPQTMQQSTGMVPTGYGTPRAVQGGYTPAAPVAFGSSRIVTAQPTGPAGYTTLPPQAAPVTRRSFFFQFSFHLLPFFGRAPFCARCVSRGCGFAIWSDDC